MLFIMNAQGDVTAASATSVKRGAINVNELTLIAPYLGTARVHVQLPNKTVTEPKLMTPITDKGIWTDADGNSIFVYQLTLDFPLTAIPGSVSLQFVLSVAAEGEDEDVTGGEISSGKVTFTVSKGVPHVPVQVAGEQLSYLAGIVAAAQSAEKECSSAKDAVVKAKNAAATSETNAKTSETNAKTSETNAKTSETNAKTSETNAKTSETNAAKSASTAESIGERFSKILNDHSLQIFDDDGYRTSIDPGTIQVHGFDDNENKMSLELTWDWIARGKGRYFEQSSVFYLPPYVETGEGCYEATLATTDDVDQVRSNVPKISGISLTLDETNFKYTFQLRGCKYDPQNKKYLDEENIGAPVTIDLPLETVVVGGEYDEKNKQVVLSLKGGSTVRFSVADLVSGLVSQTAYNAKVKSLEAADESTQEALKEQGDSITEIQQQLAKGGGGGLTEDEVKEIVATETEGKFAPNPNELSGATGDGYITILDAGGTVFKQRFCSGKYRGSGTIPHRMSNGEICVGDATADTHATTLKQLKSYTAPISDNTRRIENLESTLLTFIEDTDTAYEKAVPVGVGENAVLSYIKGTTKTTKNLLDPRLFTGYIGTGVSINEDGSVRVSYDFGDTPYYTAIEVNGDLILPAGEYYLTTNSTVLSGESVTIGNASFGGVFEGRYTLTLTEETPVSLGVMIEGNAGGFVEADVYVMLSTDPNAEFEPYFEGERYGKVTAIESYGSNLFNPQWLIDYATDAHKNNITPYGNGVKVTSYPCATTITFAKFLELTGLKVGDTFSTLCKMKRADGTVTSGTHSISFDGWLDTVNITPLKITITEDMLKYTSLTIYVESTTADNPVYITDTMVVKSDTITDYKPFSAEPIDTFVIPQEIQARNGYGKEGFVLDFDSKTSTYEGKVNDEKAYLAGYDKFKPLKVQGGGKIRFVSEYELAIPSETTYVKEKE